jgi:hypothetical protein
VSIHFPIPSNDQTWWLSLFLFSLALPYAFCCILKTLHQMAFFFNFTNLALRFAVSSFHMDQDATVLEWEEADVVMYCFARTNRPPRLRISPIRQTLRQQRTNLLRKPQTRYTFPKLHNQINRSLIAQWLRARLPKKATRSHTSRVADLTNDCS